ncbi:MAG: Ig-like domain-containing protein, partial [Terracidiphilus sp.]
MRSLMGRSLRLEWVAGLCAALALPAFGFSAVRTQGLATETRLTAETHDTPGGTQAQLSVVVTGADGQPAGGTVVIQDAGKPLAGLALDAAGQAAATLTLAPGDHNLAAVYAGDQAHLVSTSQITPVRAVTGGAFNFTVSVAPTTLSLTAGQSGTVVASVTPVNASSLTAPMFVTLSCSGLPDQSACTFTPTNIEIPPNTAAPINTTMVLATSAGIAATARLTSPHEQD